VESGASRSPVIGKQNKITTSKPFQDFHRQAIEWHSPKSTSSRMTRVLQLHP